jgi:hypothetical protein
MMILPIEPRETMLTLCWGWIADFDVGGFITNCIIRRTTASSICRGIKCTNCKRGTGEFDDAGGMYWEWVWINNYWWFT